jgi:hypothetical protein
MKESLMENKILKEIRIKEIWDVNYINKSKNINIEFHFVYKLLKLTQNDLKLSFSNNIYLRSNDINLKLNFLKCFIDEFDHLFFNFHHFDLFFIFL